MNSLKYKKIKLLHEFSFFVLAVAVATVAIVVIEPK